MPDNKKIKSKIENLGLEKEKPVSLGRSILEKLGSAQEKEKNINTFRELKKVGSEDLNMAEDIKPVGGISVSGYQTDEQKHRQKEIEKILQTGLEEIYAGLQPEKQKQFKQAGEETAREINNLLSKAKIKIKEIINLIIKWLSLIPRVNKFFLEQEAKIKADEILKIKLPK